VTYPGMRWTDLRNAYLHEVRVCVCEWHCWHAYGDSFLLRTCVIAGAAVPWRSSLVFMLCSMIPSRANSCSLYASRCMLSVIVSLCV
jgi:hypothetical protein